MKQTKIANLSMGLQDAENNVAKLNEKFGGKTCMKLKFSACPAYGSFDVYVEGFAKTEAELKGMVLYLFANALMGV